MLQSVRAVRALVLVRIAVACLLMIHGLYRILVPERVAGFGEFLVGQGLIGGAVVAWGITLVEIVGGALLASGRWIRPIAVWFAVQLTAGIVLVHRHDGWFVVGGGRNGMEYSVLLIVVLLAVAWGADDATGHLRHPGSG